MVICISIKKFYLFVFICIFIKRRSSILCLLLLFEIHVRAYYVITIDDASVIIFRLSLQIRLR